MINSLCLYINEKLLPPGSSIEVQASDDLLTVGVLDSMKLMRLVQHVEQKYKLSIPPEDLVLENFQTVDQIVDYISTRTQS